MKLALLGCPIQHSLSPSLYKELLGTQLESYDLLEFSNPTLIPSLEELAAKYDGINITTPYKQYFLGRVLIPSTTVATLGAINTISFTRQGYMATNTDVVAVEEILKNYIVNFGKINVILLGDGVMARLTRLVCEKLKVSLKQFSRKTQIKFNELDLIPYRMATAQNIIINSCSRDFIFQGKASENDIFWDYNYSFSPHSETLPQLVKTYEDGREMLRRQALAAIEFWKQTNPKLKS